MPSTAPAPLKEFIKVVRALPGTAYGCCCLSAACLLLCFAPGCGGGRDTRPASPPPLQRPSPDHVIIRSIQPHSPPPPPVISIERPAPVTEKSRFPAPGKRDTRQDVDTATATTERAAKPMTYEAHVRRYIQELERKRTGNEASDEDKRALFHLYYQRGEYDLAGTLLEEITDHDPPEMLLRGLVLYKLGETERGMNLIEQAQRILKQDSLIRIPVLAFSMGSDRYGIFRPRPGSVFSSGEGVLIYMEVENFVCREIAGEQYQLNLDVSLEFYVRDLFGGIGALVHQRSPFEQIRETSSRYIHDLYIPVKFYMPQLNPGNYVIKVIVQDRLKNEENEKMLEFEIR